LAYAVTPDAFPGPLGRALVDDSCCPLRRPGSIILLSFEAPQVSALGQR
jgi:hypothetical protein